MTVTVEILDHTGKLWTTLDFTDAQWTLIEQAATADDISCEQWLLDRCKQWIEIEAPDLPVVIEDEDG